MIEADSGGNLLDTLTHLVNHLLSGSAPNSLAPFIAGANLFSLPKKDGGIQPVAAIAQSLNTLSIDFLTLKLHLNWSKTEIIGVPDAIQICSNLCHSSPANNTTGNFKLLGSPIGSTYFIKDVLLRDLLPRLTKEIEVIANLPDPQSAYLLLRHCASATKLGHLIRTISPLTLRASQLTVTAKIQVSLPFRLGGFGLRNTTIHSSNAFVNSVQAVSKISSREPNQYVSFEGALSELKSIGWVPYMALDFPNSNFSLALAANTGFTFSQPITVSVGIFSKNTLLPAEIPSPPINVLIPPVLPKETCICLDNISGPI
ncbi:hypothetical protein GJ496_009314 [Pomphorhynchus laevis]|nr:hypothetical protein GJ496_009314 [Pomphorhynchus laevis]